MPTLLHRLVIASRLRLTDILHLHPHNCSALHCNVYTKSVLSYGVSPVFLASEWPLVC